MTDARQVALDDAVHRAGSADPELLEALTRLWDLAFEQGRVAALDELQDRFCVCMK